MTIPPSRPRAEITVTHSGHVHLATCDHCTGTVTQLIELLETLIKLLRRGVDDHGRPVADRNAPWPPTANFN